MSPKRIAELRAVRIWDPWADDMEAEIPAPVECLDEIERLHSLGDVAGHDDYDDWAIGKKDGRFEMAWEIQTKICAGWTTEQLLEHVKKEME